ncbi:MAG TPA: hypothetical protein VHE30_17270, partial [Polyangiaceae bacterium]|nr:hypothetical protein [Polyangiaceae bacterium]
MRRNAAANPDDLGRRTNLPRLPGSAVVLAMLVTTGASCRRVDPIPGAESKGPPGTAVPAAAV